MTDLVAAGCVPAGRTRISGVRIGAWLRGVHLAIQLVGFGRALRILTVATPAYARADLPPEGLLTALKQAVESRSRRSLLVGGDCKAEAMTAFLLLRRHGLAATLRVGIREHPFSLHAWTSSNGMSIPDAAPGGHVFTPVLSISGQ